MSKSILDIPFAIVGGGNFCRIFLEFILDTDFGGRSPSILGVADENEEAEGFRFARSRGIFTTRDYRDFYGFQSLAMIVELTKDPVLAEIIKEEAPEQVEVVNHFEVRSLWDEVQVEAVRAVEAEQPQGGEVGRYDERLGQGHPAGAGRFQKWYRRYAAGAGLLPAA